MTEKNQNEFKPMKFTAHHDAYVDHMGYEYKEYNSEFESLWKMDNGWTYFVDYLGKEVFLRNQLDTAIKICEERNRTRKVKVKRL